MGVLDEIQAAIATVAETAGPAVVGLRTGRHRGGCGVVIADGTVLTVAHALRGEEVEALFAGGRRAPARVRGVDADLGIALLETDTGDTAPLAWADAPPSGPGAAVVALADPGGRGLRVTLGFVSAAEESFRGPRGRRVSGAIEHTAPLPRGSSGGPLVDLDGRLVGVNAARRDGGLILALAADEHLRGRVDRLTRGEAVEPRRLGVAVAPPRLARRMRRAVGLPERDGLLVRAVQEGSPAARAGLEVGDLLVRAGERALDDLDALHAAIDAVDGTGALALGVVRGTEERLVEVTFG